jgi:hypothetical protein
MKIDHAPRPKIYRPAMPETNVARAQFIRVEKFAQKAPFGKQGGNNIFKVAHEAARTEGFCSHIEHPLPPTLLYGVSPLEATVRAENWVRQQTAQYFHQPSQTLMTRKFRADKPCALVGVISVPPEWVPDQRWVLFCEKSLTWLKEKYGEDRLCSVLEHRDERCLHLHFWILPLDGENFSTIHQGEKAIDDVGRTSARVIREAAYKKAMAKLLDEFHQGVGIYFGLERETVDCKRLSRKDWLHKKFLDEQREQEIQMRINSAVQSAIYELRMTFNANKNAARSIPKLDRKIQMPGFDFIIDASCKSNTATQSKLSMNKNRQDNGKIEADPVTTSSILDSTVNMREHSTQQWLRPRNR